jgi:NhaA family Na+:H+ antiporter
MKLTRLFLEFFNSEKAGGLVLILCTVFSLIIANTDAGSVYLGVWTRDLAGHTLRHWINDGLMAIFFLLIGLELEREIYAGELSDFKLASFPLIGAIGGMVVPAGLYLALNFGTPAQAGAGIPMATDIAFAIGILSLLGKHVPATLKIFLIALAVIDDLGAIMVIAFFYTSGVVWINLLIALGIFGLLLVFNRLKVHNLIPYLVGGVIMWYFMLHSGIHATLTGVLLAFAIPFGNGDEKSPSYRLQHYLHYPVAFLIIPLFALANTGIVLGQSWTDSLLEPGSIGIFLGLVAGKPLGIILFTFAGSLLGLCSLPAELKWSCIAGVGFLGGIGFTMSIFITLLAYDSATMVDSSKIAVLIASAVAGITGYIMLLRTLPREVGE